MPPNITKIFLLVFQLLLLLLLSLTKFWGCSPSARMGTPPRGGTQGRQQPPGELNLIAFIHQPFLFLPVGVVFYKASLSSLSISRDGMGVCHTGCKDVSRLCILELSFGADEPVVFLSDWTHYFLAKHCPVNSFPGI